jgi:hypothetical protein
MKTSQKEDESKEKIINIQKEDVSEKSMRELQKILLKNTLKLSVLLIKRIRRQMVHRLRLFPSRILL